MLVISCVVVVKTNSQNILKDFIGEHVSHSSYGNLPTTILLYLLFSITVWTPYETYTSSNYFTCICGKCLRHSLEMESGDYSFCSMYQVICLSHDFFFKSSPFPITDAFWCLFYNVFELSSVIIPTFIEIFHVYD